jgi:hypothetical protein
VPPSGVLVTPPPAPSAVPPSGVLLQPEPVERRTVTTVPVKTVQPLHTAERAAPPTMRRHVVQTAARRGLPRTLAREDGAERVTTTRTTTIRQRIVAPPLVVTMVAATPAYVSSGPRYYNFAGRPMDITPAPAPSLARQRAAPAVNSAAPVVATPPNASLPLCLRSGSHPCDRSFHDPSCASDPALRAEPARRPESPALFRRRLALRLKAVHRLRGHYFFRSAVRACELRSAPAPSLGSDR